MKVAFACYAYPPEGSNGGLASFYYELANALTVAGHSVLVIALTEGESKREVINGVAVERVNFEHKSAVPLSNLEIFPALSWFLPRAVKLYKEAQPLLRDFDPDVLECAEHGFLWLFQAANRKKPLVVRCLCPAYHVMTVNNQTPVNALDLHLVTAAESHLIRCADALTTPSKSLAGIVSEQSKVMEGEFFIVRNPLSPLSHSSLRIESHDSKAACNQRLLEDRPDRTLTETENTIHTDKGERAFPRILFVGRIEKLKGCDLLIEMMPSVLQEYPLAELTLVGNDSIMLNDNRTFGDTLRLRLAELGCQHRVNFTGAVPRHELPRYFEQADICAFPSRYDSSPYACLEAMLEGVPVIATAVGGIPEYIEHGVTGWLVPSEDPAALAAAIKQLAMSDSLRENLGKAGRQSVMEMCAPLSIAHQSVDVYQTAIAKFKSGAKLSFSADSDPVLASIISAFDDFAENDRIEEKFKFRLQEAWQNGYSAGQKAGREESPSQSPQQLAKLCSKLVKRIAKTLKN